MAINLFGGRHLRSRGVALDLLVLSIAYPAGSALMGAVFGLGAPHMRGHLRSALVGMAALAPPVLGIGLGMENGLTLRRA